ncbi:MAG: hypothetical protein QXH91_07605 [Candidatus Bathyarchaeia archaeon]
MRTEKRGFIAFFVMLFWACLAWMMFLFIAIINELPSAIGEACGEILENITKPLEEDLSSEENPSIYENRVVWSDYAKVDDEDEEENDEEAEDVARNIFLYDMNIGETTRLTFSKNDQDYPKIYGDYVVWLEYVGEYEEGKPREVHLLNIAINEDLVIANNYLDNHSPSIFEQYVCWLRGYDTGSYINWDVMLYDIEGCTTLNITEQDEDTDRISPVIYANNLCWSEPVNQSVICYNIDTAEKSVYTLEEAKPYDIDIYENLVAIEGRLEDGNSNIYLLDIDSGTIQQLTETPLARENPKIYGDVVIWSQEYNFDPELCAEVPEYCFNILMLNLKTGEARFPIANTQTPQLDHDIWGDHIVWEGYEVEKEEGEEESDNNSSQSCGSDIYLYSVSKDEYKCISCKED